MGKPRLLWIGDAGVSTGFARCTHRTLDVLREEYDVAVLGLNFVGEPHSMENPHPWPYPIYPAMVGGDAFGVRRTEPIIKKFAPDVVVVQNDPWNVPAYLEQIPNGIPVVATMPVDGKNCTLGLKLAQLKKRAWKGKADHATRLACAVFWTQFGLREARAGGYDGPAAVIPLGIDLEIYKPTDKMEAREKLGFPPEIKSAYIVGNVNRNQPRKRLDLTIEYFADWVRRYNVSDAYLYLQLAPTGETGYDALQLMQYYGFHGEQKRLILVEPELGIGLDESIMPFVYSALDVQVTTTQGEGWGLTTMEGMACGVPQIVPEWAALGEWASAAAQNVPCYDHAVTVNKVNAVGGIADRGSFVESLQALYTRPEARRTLSEAGLALVRKPEYRWRSVGEQFGRVIETALGRGGA